MLATSVAEIVRAAVVAALKATRSRRRPRAPTHTHALIRANRAPRHIHRPFGTRSSHEAGHRAAGGLGWRSNANSHHPMVSRSCTCPTRMPPQAMPPQASRSIDRKHACLVPIYLEIESTYLQINQSNDSRSPLTHPTDRHPGASSAWATCARSRAAPRFKNRREARSSPSWCMCGGRLCTV